ncbi:MAG: hypothetical protein WED33_01170 [Bacteroidia bacterium]
MSSQPTQSASSDRNLDFTEKISNRHGIGEQERNNRIINSAIAYLAAFTITYVSFNLVTALFAKRYHLFYKLFFFKVDFTQNYDLWTIDSVLKTFIAGPVFCLLAGTIALIVQKLYRKRPGIQKTFWLWLGIHYFNLFCAQVVLMPIKNTGSQGINASFLGIVADYLYWEDFSKLIASILATLLLIFIGSLVAKPFIQITNSTLHVVKNENKIVYLFQTVLLPYIIGSAISLVYFSDGSFILNLALVFCLFVIIVSIFINALKNRMIMIYRLPETGLIENRFLIILASVLILMKIFLNNGIMF